ncbi:phosphate/phosphite/phosphonate ABC transporter substrate-binding protein [Natroniella acetigena]|uniref:phosphate/phosphite/phosphonate ABC transporter substrate-binding protein n=1 Tax=Natroniella acetigena TaxID=52004 RepID=UPI00200AE007|nr:phosphate/phosphite/phosphonate ABC transporter substrate-binding protein [Natroniella acetigena]MCK8826522.1 phosphate/phosphite/phosphonate ABC transporter substrate-binding protein [Natroniella acetigena]
MKKGIALSLVLILTVGILVSFAGETEAFFGWFSSSEEEEVEKIVFADTMIEGMADFNRRFGPFKEKLEEVLGVEVEVQTVSDRTAAATALEFNQVDIVLTGPSEYIAITSEVEVEPIVTLTRPGYKGRGYKSVFIVPADSELETLEDLKGKKLAMKDVGSTSGHIGPSSILIEHGFDLDQDLDIKMLDDARIEAMRTGDVDAVATGMRDYTMLEEEAGEDAYRLIHKGAPLPNDLFIANRELSDEFVEEIREKMLEHQDELVAAMLETGENPKYSNSELIIPDEESYEQMRRAYERLGLLN